MATEVATKDRIFASLVANISVTVLTNPLDVMKVRAQAYNEGTFDAFRAIASQRGFRGFYSGVIPALCMSIPTVSIYYTTYDALRPALEEKGLPVTLAGSLAGGSARMLAVSVASPLELIKTQLQYGAHSYHNKHSTATALRNLWEGKRLWTGLGATLLRDVPFSLIYWFLVETIRAYGHDRNHAAPLAMQLAAGVGGGIIASLITHPSDVIKTLQQTPAGAAERSSRSKKGVSPGAAQAVPCAHGPNCQVGCSALGPRTSSIAACARKIYCADGIRGFYVGLLPRLVRVPISCGLMLTSFEGMKLLLKRSHEPKKAT